MNAISGSGVDQSITGMKVMLDVLLNPTDKLRWIIPAGQKHLKTRQSISGLKSLLRRFNVV